LFRVITARLALTTCLLGCTEDTVCGDRAVTSTASAALTSGSADASYLRLEDWEELAVIELTLFEGTSQPTICSATFVAPDRALTARHCLEALPSGEIRGRLHFRNGMRSQTLTVTSWAGHPTLDLALVRVLDGSFGRGTLVQLGGFGITERGISGERRFVVAEVEAVEAEFFAVNSQNLGGACDGDSGGPALLRGPDGQVWIAGVLQGGTSSCYGTDRYIRVDMAGQWLAEKLGAMSRVSPPGVRRESLGMSGRCFHENLAVWSDAGQIRAEHCDDGQSCGWDSRTGGFRCVDPDVDPCGGVTDLGRCEGDVALRCADGVVRSSACFRCGWSCGRSPRSGESVCFEIAD
jgi:hypothetical protein